MKGICDYWGKTMMDASTSRGVLEANNVKHELTTERLCKVT